MDDGSKTNAGLLKSMSGPRRPAMNVELSRGASRPAEPRLSDEGRGLETSKSTPVEEGVVAAEDTASAAADRKPADKPGENERLLLRALIDNLPDLIYFKDIKGRYVLNNRAHLLSMGVTCQEDVLGKTTFGFHPPELAERYHRDEMDIVSTGKALLDREEIALHRDTGENRWHPTSEIPLKTSQGVVTGIVGISRDITDRKLLEEQRDHYVRELQEALEKVKTLSGLLPICSGCKKIRDDKGYWQQVDNYFMEHSSTRFTHGLCPDCIARLYPELAGCQGKGGPTSGT